MNHNNFNLDNIINSFVISNSQITSKYFQFTEKVADILIQNKENETLSRLLTQVETVTSLYLDSQQQLVKFLKNFDDAEPTNFKENNLLLESVENNKSNSDHYEYTNKKNASLTTSISNEDWLKIKIAEITGYPNDKVNLNKSFNELGMDSINIFDLIDECTKKFSELESKKAELLLINSPNQLLEIINTCLKTINNDQDVVIWITQQIAAISGFSKEQINLMTPYSQLGLDSIALFDLIDNIKKKWPATLKVTKKLLEAQTPEQTIHVIKASIDISENTLTEKVGSIFNKHLLQLLPELSKGYENNKLFTELGIDGFKRKILWESISKEIPECAFLGEALIATRTPDEAIKLIVEFLPSKRKF